MVNCRIMTASNPRSALPETYEQEPTATAPATDESRFIPEFDQVQWSESQAERGLHGSGGRAVLAWTLTLLAILWTGYTAWSAGRALADAPLGSPAVAQWVAIATGPLALLGLGWLMFGRTRRRETERFTRSVIEMRTEARALETVLGVLSQKIDESQTSLATVTHRLMQLGDDATAKLGGVTREFDSSSDRLVHHANLFDRAAEAARTDIAVLLDDLPRAEQSARAMSEQLRDAGRDALSGAVQFERQVAALVEQTRLADERVTGASQRLSEQLTAIDRAGAQAGARVSEAEASMTSATDALLVRAVSALDEIRSGIDVQAAAVAALVDQASAGFSRTGVDAAQAIEQHIASADGALGRLATTVSAQELATAHMIAEVDRSITGLHQRFAEFAATGDERAAAYVATLSQARGELQGLAADTEAQAPGLDALAQRTTGLREGVQRLTEILNEQLTAGLEVTGSAAKRLLEVTQAARPEVDWMRDAAVEASDRIGQSAAVIVDQQDRLAALLAAVDDGVGSAGERLQQLSAALAETRQDATQLTAETGPALVAAMVQVREAAAHAADRAREALQAVIPGAAESLSDATRAALEQAIREGVEERLREVETAAAHAVETARAASDRLTQQMLALGRSAAALEQHMEETDAAQKEKDSEAFARRVSLLIDSMNSASIDVGKILADEIDDKAWDSYLKGNRGVFTRRAVRLLDGSESRAIRGHYEADGEFQRSVNRYVHDFEAMLRRVLAEREGGIIAVTLMSSDMGKLYAALAQAIDRRR